MINGTVQITGPIAPTSSGDTYPTHDAKYGKDGLRNVDTIVDLINLPIDRRRSGMIIGVSGGTSYYKLKPEPWEISINDWIQVYFSSSSSVSFLELSDTPSTFTSSAALIVNSSGTALEYTEQIVKVDMDLVADAEPNYLLYVEPIIGFPEKGQGVNVFGDHRQYAQRNNLIYVINSLITSAYTYEGFVIVQDSEFSSEQNITNIALEVLEIPEPYGYIIFFKHKILASSPELITISGDVSNYYNIGDVFKVVTTTNLLDIDFKSNLYIIRNIIFDGSNTKIEGFGDYPEIQSDIPGGFIIPANYYMELDIIITKGK